MTRPATRTRPAFTLIELLIVIGIVVVLASLAYMFVPNLDKNKGVPNAVTQLEGWIRLSKAQALRDGAPRGIRLIPDDNDPTRCVALQYIEQPEPISPRGTVGALRIGLRISNTTATLVLIDQTTNQPTAAKDWDEVLNPQIFDGDYLELSTGEHVIARINGNPQPSTDYPGPTRSTLNLDRLIDGADVNPLVITEGFRVIRAPRPLVGEPLLQMNKDVFIDLTNCNPCPVPIAGNGFTSLAHWSTTPDPYHAPLHYIDILFNSSGFVANATTGHLALCVRHLDDDRAQPPQNALLVVVYTRTGKISAAFWNDVGGVDPYAFMRDGRASGL